MKFILCWIFKNSNSKIYTMYHWGFLNNIFDGPCNYEGSENCWRNTEPVSVDSAIILVTMPRVISTLVYFIPIINVVCYMVYISHYAYFFYLIKIHCTFNAWGKLNLFCSCASAFLKPCMCIKCLLSLALIIQRLQSNTRLVSMGFFG